MSEPKSVPGEGAQLVLRRPAPEWLESYRQACAESFGHVHNPYILHDPARFDTWRHTIFAQFRDEEAGLGLPDGFVPSATFWLIGGGEYVGTVNIRKYLNAALADYGGHLGMVIRCSRRGEGLASAGCSLGIEQAKAMGIDPVLVTCIESNVPSLRSLLRLPYRRMECAVTRADGVITPIRRFWF